MKVYIETGEKKVFACAEEWPGWCRCGKDEEKAMQALFDSRFRYARAVTGGKMVFVPPVNLYDHIVTARYQGDSGTDFGVPAVIPDSDREPVEQAEFGHF